MPPRVLVGQGTRNESGRRDGQPLSNGQGAPIIRAARENSTSSSTIVIDGSKIYSVALLGDGRYGVSGGEEGKVRIWQVCDGREAAGAVMDAGGLIANLAASQDGGWLVSGTKSGLVAVWDTRRRAKALEFRGHAEPVRAVDISPNGSLVATGSDDKTVCVWVRLSGQRLLAPLKHDDTIAAVKFSPGGRLIATATWNRASVRVYDSRDGRVLADFAIRVNSGVNQSVAWAGNNLFVLSREGNIHCLDPFAGTTLSQWPIHSSNDPRCIALAGNGTFIAASAHRSVSLWDTATHKQIGPVIDHAHVVWSMAISARNDIMAAGDQKLTLLKAPHVLPSPYCDGTLVISRTTAEKAHTEDTILSLHQKLAISQQRFTNVQREANQKENSLNETIRSLRIDLRARDMGPISRTQDLDRAVQDLRDQLTASQQAASQKEDKLARTIQVHEKKHQCETLFARDRIHDAIEPFLEVANSITRDQRDNRLLMDWVSEFSVRCASRLQTIGDEASNASKHDDALAAYSMALSLTPAAPNSVLAKWAKTILTRRSAGEALNAATKFKLPRFHVYRAICDVLEGNDRVLEAVECYRRIQNELQDDAATHDERAQWELDFRRRSLVKLERLGDTAMGSQNYDAAIRYYSNALQLDPPNVNDILAKRSRAQSAIGSLENALTDAIEAIERNPSSYEGYERKHAALHRMGRHKEAFSAFETMLSKLNQSTVPHLRELSRQYVDATPMIQEVIQETIRDIPRVLIDVPTGELYDKARQAAAFEDLPIYDKLRSSMITWDQLDRSRIEREVKTFYQYVMLSHKWEPDEPTFQKLENKSIYELPTSPTNNKLLMFCLLVRSLHFKWAWSDTSCVNQMDKGVQQESVVAMFRWYCGSTLTIVHLLGVSSDSQEFGCLWRSIWNTRGWTYQEYLASNVVQFYTEDWKPYLGLDIFNHKESPVILEEMEQAMSFGTDELATLRPGLEMAREKLYLASQRKTTREEDIAYSLFGIFSVALPVIYGEGNQAVGRLLEHILTRSENVTLLSWTGTSGTQHSYLPADLTVYNQIAPPHVPKPIDEAEMDAMILSLHASLPNPSMVVKLYEQLHDLPPMSLAAGRLGLSGIVFTLTDLVALSAPSSGSQARMYRATTPMLGEVLITTTEDLSECKGLVFMHPWISPMVDVDFTYDGPKFDLPTRALRLMMRLQAPFGALLLTLVRRVGRPQYRRVATDSLIIVQVREGVGLEELMEGIRTVDIQ